MNYWIKGKLTRKCKEVVKGIEQPLEWHLVSLEDWRVRPMYVGVVERSAT